MYVFTVYTNYWGVRNEKKVAYSKLTLISTFTMSSSTHKRSSTSEVEEESFISRKRPKTSQSKIVNMKKNYELAWGRGVWLVCYKHRIGRYTRQCTCMYPLVV